MKTQILNFGGGLIVGLIVFTMISASEKSDYPSRNHVTIEGDDCFPYSDDAFLEVEMEEFLTDLSRYYTKHAKVIRQTMPKKEVEASLSHWANIKNKDKRKKKEKFIAREPSRMFIYSIDTLKKFIGLIEKYGKMADIDRSELGIRFYYGVYPREKTIAGEDYGSLHTLFMVPNHWNSSDNQFYDIEIRKLARTIKDMNDKSIPIDEDTLNTLVKNHYFMELYKKNPRMSAFMLDASTVRYTGPSPVTIINQGQLCPPNCPTFHLLTKEEVDW